MIISTHVGRVRILYKTILRLHRGMPEELRKLGDDYVKEEFKRHKNCKHSEADIFMHEWTDYATTLAKQLGLRGVKTAASKLGKSLNEEDLEKLREEQVHQLYELMLASRNEEVNKQN